MNARRELIDGPAGKLELALNEPTVSPRGLALIAHPHPLYGGTLDNKVVQTLARAFVALDYVSMRVNFRGVGESEGVYDEGRGETLDLLAALEYGKSRFGALPLVLAGFSFGAYVQTRVAASAPSQWMVLVGPAAGRFDLDKVPENTLIIHGEQDDVVALKDVFDWARPQNLPVVVLPGAGHFFHGALTVLQRIVTRNCPK